jgi:GTPase SAR1 family protein
VLDDRFKVLIMGEFKRGKSTVINAMLGQEILPAFATPTTAIISEVKWDDSPGALLHYLPSSDGNVKPPIEIPVNEIEEYVVIKITKEDPTGSQESPYRNIELFWPLDLCSDGVEIIDSPGLNESEIRRKITLNYVLSADAVVFVIACDFAASESELHSIGEVSKLGHEEIFFVCNRINLIRNRDRDAVKERCVSLLAPLTKLGAGSVFFVDALGALEGRVEGDQQRVEQSAVPVFEQYLKGFLASERGKVKMLRHAKALKTLIREARRMIPDRKELLLTDTETIQKRYAEAQQELHQLETQRHQIIERIANIRADATTEVRASASSFYRQVADKIEEWISAYEIKQPLNLWEASASRKAKERLVEEIVQFMSGEVDREYNEWQSTTLAGLLTSRLEEISDVLDKDALEFIAHLEQVRTAISSGTHIGTDASITNLTHTPAWERILAAAGGMLVDPGSALIGASFGGREMLKSIIPQLLIIVTLAVGVGLNPFILIPAALAGAGIQGLLRTNSINRRIKEAVSRDYEDKLRASSGDKANEIADTVNRKLDDMQEALAQELGIQIQSVRDQVESILKEKKKGQARVDEAIRSLSSTENELNEVDHALYDLIEEVGLTA